MTGEAPIQEYGAPSTPQAIPHVLNEMTFSSSCPTNPKFPQGEVLAFLSTAPSRYYMHEVVNEALDVEVSAEGTGGS